MARRVSVQFIAELAQFRRQMQSSADDVRKLRDESRAAQADIAKLGTVGERAGRHLADGLVHGADVRLRDSRSRFVHAGEQAGDGFGDGFQRGVQRRMAAADGVGSLLTDASKMLSGGRAMLVLAGGASAAVAALQGVPPLLTAIGGGLAAIPSLSAGAIGSVGALTLGFSGLGDAIEDIFEIDDPYAGLSRSGQRLVDQLAAQRDALLQVRRVAQDRLLAGLDAELAELAEVVLPFATRQVERFADTWNVTFRQLARVGRDPVFLSALDAAMAAGDRFFDGVNARIPATARSLAGLFTGSIPVVDRFGDALLGYIDDFNAWIDRSAQNGRLEEFFRDAAKQAEALMDLTREVFVLVGRIGGMQRGSTVLRDMADAVARFNSEVHSMRSVEGIIATGNEAIRGMIEVLVILGESLSETLADPGARDAIALFFDVLKTGAEIVGGLATLFRSLPDPIQSTVLAGIALAAVGGRLFSMFGKLTTAAGRVGDALDVTNERLRRAGPAGQTAARGLQSVTTWAGRAGGALIALQATSLLFAAFRDGAADVDRLTLALHRYATTGELAGELTKVLAADQEETSKVFKAASDAWWANTLRFVESIPVLGDVQRAVSETFHGQSFTSAKENVAALDEALAHLVETSGRQAGIEAWNRLLSQSGMNADELIKLLPSFEEALRRSDSAASDVARRQQLLNGSMREAITLVGSYTRAWAQLNGEMLASDEAMLAAEDALDQLRDSLKENGDAIKGNSRAALENRVAVGRFAQAAADAAQAKYEETGSIEAANEVYEGYIRQLRRTLDQAGLTDTQIEELISTYASMPEVKTTEIVAKTDSAKKAVRDFLALYASVKDRSVTIHGHVRWTSSGLKVPGGTILEGNRWGGVYEHAQDGLLREARVFSPRPPEGRYVIAEPATGGEAFIPKFGNRERSIAIGRQAMEWYGMAVVPKQAVEGQPTPVVVRATTVIDYARLAAAIAAVQPSGRQGITVEKLEVRAFSDRFSLREVEDELAFHGAH